MFASYIKKKLVTFASYIKRGEQKVKQAAVLLLLAILTLVPASMGQEEPKFRFAPPYSWEQEQEWQIYRIDEQQDQQRELDNAIHDINNRIKSLYLKYLKSFKHPNERFKWQQQIKGLENTRSDLLAALAYIEKEARQRSHACIERRK